MTVLSLPLEQVFPAGIEPTIIAQEFKNNIEICIHLSQARSRQTLDFTDYSVTFCQNKKTRFHLGKTPFGAHPVLGAPGGCNYSVPPSSFSWPPSRISFATMIIWFSYQITSIISCLRSTVDNKLSADAVFFLYFAYLNTPFRVSITS